MRLGKIVKWGGVTLAGLYAATYLGLTAFALIDSKIKANKPHEQRQTLLVLREARLTVEINGKKKDLVLLGDARTYNQKESEIVEKLVEEHKYIAYEGGSSSELSLGNLIYHRLGQGLSKIPLFYYKLGSNRYSGDMISLVQGKDRRVHRLENLDSLYRAEPFSEKFGTSVLYFFGAATAPLYYFTAKDVDKIMSRYNIPTPLTRREDEYRAFNIANGIIDLLKRDEVDSLLVGTYIQRLDDVIQNLLVRSLESPT